MPESTKSSLPDLHLWITILAGGVGSRFWPVSTPVRPKQLLPLASEQPLIADTVARVLTLVPRDHIRILTGEHLASPILSAVPELTEAEVMVEPRARGTGPVLAWAAAEIFRRDPEGIMASLHSDHVIEPDTALREMLVAAAECARANQRLVTIGITPTRPETGYGYIKPGARLEARFDAYEVQQFVEKPDRENATQYVQRGYVWNSGIFVWPVKLFLDEIREHATEIAPHLALALEGDAQGFFNAVSSTSVDEAVLERSDRVAVMPATFHWDDVGAWDAVGRTRKQDANGNVAVGDIAFVDSNSSIAWAEAGSVVLFGVDDLVVVRTANITFVARRDRTPDLKRLLEQIPPAMREVKDPNG
ncbi:MAG TPA: sugar phosphate nucleotidyltransferase [Longimicrobiales bacterium]